MCVRNNIGSDGGWREVIILDDTKTRIIIAAIKAVRQYGLEGVRIQNVSDLAGISPGALYRHFESKDQMIVIFSTLNVT